MITLPELSLPGRQTLDHPRYRRNRDSEALTLLNSDEERVRALFLRLASARTDGNIELADTLCRLLLETTEVEEICYSGVIAA